MKRIHAAIIFLAVLASSCTGSLSVQQAQSFVLSSRDIAMDTKGAVPFDHGTSYFFFAFNRNADGAEFEYPAVIQAPGTESADGTIGFAEGTRNHFGGRSMDFYGLTYADADAGHWTTGCFETNQSSAPKYLLERDSNGKLADLRHGVLKNVSGSNTSGRLEVDFHHALSKLRFVAARQDADNLSGIYITSISVEDYPGAQLNLASGEWAAQGPKAERTIYSYQPSDPGSPASEKQLTPSSTLVTEELVFPTLSAGMKVRVRTYNPTVSDEHHSNISQTLEELFEVPMALEANHQYTLSITITNKGVKIIIMTPQEADWIENEQSEMNLGQPVTFAGITWADRNLGATFAPENNKVENITNIRDWDNMRGYYFQFGRNVPYFILKNRKISKPTTLSTDFANNDFTYCDGGRTDRTAAPYALLDGNSIQQAYDAAKNYKSAANWADVSSTGVMPLAYTATKRDAYDKTKNYVDISDYDGTPQDAKRFAIISGSTDDTAPWWIKDGGRPNHGTPDTWNDVSRQPCPKGWRMPTRDDWAYIMPLSKRTGDITFNPGGDTKTNQTYSYEDADGVTHSIKNYVYSTTGNREFNNHYRQSKVVAGNVVWWAETGGDRCNIKIDGKPFAGLEESLGDPIQGYISQYLCVSPVSNLTRGVLYAIKCAGTNEAYRLKWEFVIHNTMPEVGKRNGVSIYPVTLRISRYVSNASEELRNLDDLNSLDWEHPAEVMELPDCGYVLPEVTSSYKPVLVNSGNETIYASSTIDPSDGFYYAVRVKYNEFSDAGSLASRYLMLIKMRRSYGMCIRPVRDNSIVID